MGEIQEGRSEHPALIAFKETLWSNERVPLASETYLKLARRHIRSQTGQGASFERRPPSPEAGRQFARALLGRNMEVAKWETDWDIRSFTRGQADKWLRKPDPYKLNELIIYSVKSAVAWDTLQLITKGLADSRLDRPDDLLHWNFEVATGLRKRPEEGSAPSHRRQKLGYKLRNNEFRRSVELLQAVGMTKTAGCKAVAEAAPYVISLSRVRSICQKGYCTVPELGEDAMVCLEPSFYSFLYGPDSNSVSYRLVLSRNQPLPAVTSHPRRVVGFASTASTSAAWNPSLSGLGRVPLPLRGLKPVLYVPRPPPYGSRS